MTKSRISPGFNLYQIVVQEFGSRKRPANQVLSYYRDKRGVHEVVESVPQRTFLRWARNGKQAMKKVKKFGTVISCFKVHSHEKKLQMIEHLRLEKPIEIDIRAEEFIVGKDLEIEPLEETKNISVDGA